MKCPILRVICAAAVISYVLPLNGCSSPKRRPEPAAEAKEDPALKRVLKLRWFDRLQTVGVRSAFLVDDSIYIDTIEGILYRCNRPDGGIVWGSKITYPLDGPPRSDGRGYLYAMSGGKLIVLDEGSGALIRRRRVQIGPLRTVFPTSEALAYAGTDSSIHVISSTTGYDMISPVRIGANVLSIDSVSDDLLHMVIDPVYDQAYVAAFFSSSGREAWRTPIGPKPLADLGLYEGSIFVGGTDYYVRAVDSRAGRVRWKVPVGGAAMDRPKLSRNRVFVVTDNGYLHCLDARNGKALWQKNLRDRIRFITADDDHVVVERSGRRLVIVDAKTGEEIATTLPMKYRFLLADPDEGLFCRITRDGHLVCVELIASQD